MQNGIRKVVRITKGQRDAVDAHAIGDLSPPSQLARSTNWNRVEALIEDRDPERPDSTKVTSVVEQRDQRMLRLAASSSPR